MPRYEYLKLKLAEMSAEIISEYGL